MAKFDDDRRAAVEAAVRTAAINVLSRSTAIGDAIAQVATALAGVDVDLEATPRERIELARRARRAVMLAELDRLERSGHRRDAVGIVSRRYAVDPMERESLQRWLRRHRHRAA